MKAIFLILMTILFTGCTSTRTSHLPATHNNQQQFWNQLEKICGKSFVGEVVAAPANDTTFKNKILVMHVRSCAENIIRVPFMVGEDRSRTWVFSREGERLQLKHDHRHADGTEDSITQYGGMTTNTGLSTLQVFPADQFTAQLLPAAATNVWWVELVAGKYFTYNLRRMGTDRWFSVRFDLSKEVETPPAPWGF